MKVGVFCEYKFQSTGIWFLNMTFISFNSTATFRWECVELNETYAKLNVSIAFNGIDQDARDIFFSTDLYVDIVTREVVLQNGTLIGKTRLWAPAYPYINEEVFLWDNPPDRVVGKVIYIGGDQGTPQGYQKTFIVEGNGTFMGEPIGFIVIYDLDTGVMTSGTSMYEVTLLPFNIMYPGTSGSNYLSDTNIDLGPRDLWPDILRFIYIVVPIATFLGIFTFVYRRRKRRKQNIRNHHSK